MKHFIPLIAVGLLVGCANQTPAVTQSEVSAGVTLAVTLASAIAPTNKTVKQVLAAGALICGQVDSATGKLLQGTAVAMLNTAGVPVSVTDQAPAIVAGACPVSLVPGAAPAGTTNLPTATVAALPAVS